MIWAPRLQTAPIIQDEDEAQSLYFDASNTVDEKATNYEEAANELDDDNEEKDELEANSQMLSDAADELSSIEDEEREHQDRVEEIKSDLEDAGLLDEKLEEASEELQDVNYVDYKHSYCHILQPNLKKLNAIVHYYKEPLSTVKGFIFNLLKDPQIRWTKKEREFADNIREMDNSEDIYNYVVNSIEKAKTIIVKVKPNGELASMQDADLEEAAPVEFSEEELKLDEKLYSYLTDPSGFEGEVEAADEDEAFRKAETEVAQKGAYVADELIDIKEVEENLEEHINDRPADIESDQELHGTDNAVVDCEVAKVIAHSEDEKPLDCKMEKPVLEEPVAGKKVDAELYEDKEEKVETTFVDNGKGGSIEVCPNCGKEICKCNELTEAKKDDEEELPPDPGAVKVEVHGMLNDLVADEIEAINGYEDAPPHPARPCSTRRGRERCARSDRRGLLPTLREYPPRARPDGN